MMSAVLQLLSLTGLALLAAAIFVRVQLLQLTIATQAVTVNSC